MYGIWPFDNHLELACLGVCGLTSMDLINRRAEFSLYIGPEFQGQGFGKNALKTLLAHGFRNYGLNRIWGESFEGNPAIAMFESLGFEPEGIRKEFYFKGGKFIDAYLFSISNLVFEEKWGT
jgi:ribosomal-protein-alanine N-acetyltransferase